MKRKEVETQKPNFIGCWDIEDKKLCNEIISFFESNKELSKEGTTTLGKNIKAKKQFFQIEKDCFKSLGDCFKSLGFLIYETLSAI